MSLYKDFIAFVDSGSKVPYFVDNAKYVYKPNIISIQFTYDFKIFYKSYDSYYVGVPFSNFVRPITSKEFKIMKELCESRDTINNSIGTQLFFDF